MKTITFKPEFEEKLQKLGVKEKFVENMVIQSTEHGRPDFAKWYAEEEEHKNWYEFIKGGFIWFMSPENHDYWCEIAKS